MRGPLVFIAGVTDSNTPTHSAPCASLIGREVVRLSTRAGQPYWSHGERGTVVEETDARIRIKWKERRTWLARKAEGTRWAIADSEQGRDAIAWAADELERDRAKRAGLVAVRS